MSTPSLPAALARAYQLAREGHMLEAEHLCLSLLRSDDEPADALLLKAVLEIQTARPAMAAASLRRLLHREPERALAHVLLGDSLVALGRPSEALGAYERALLLSPTLFNAHLARAQVLLDLGRPAESLESLTSALALKPDDSDALFARANALHALGRVRDAVRTYDRAVAIRPNFPAALNNRGLCFMALGEMHQALRDFEDARALDPRWTDPAYNRASALRALGRGAESLQAFDEVLAGAPRHARAHLGKALLLRESKRPEEALAGFDRALSLEPELVAALRGKGDALLDLGKAEAALLAHEAALRLPGERSATLTSRGNALRAMGRFDEALASYEEAARLEPSNVAAHYNRGTTFLQCGRGLEETIASYARALELEPDYDFLAGSLFFAQRQQAEWSARNNRASTARLREDVLAGRRVIAPFQFLAASDSAQLQLACARTYADFCCPQVSSEQPPCAAHDRIRVAYVSPDFREHAVAYLMAGVFERHDRARFETLAISLFAPQSTPMGARLQSAFDRFIDVSRASDREVAELLRTLEIDVAVDLCGFTDGCRPRIFAQRVAPVQVSYLGFPGGLGASFIDYLIADRFVIPEAAEVHYRERIVFLPACFQANAARPSELSPPTRAQLGLPEKGFVYCCFNNTYKLNPVMFDVWMRLLAETPGSILWLVAHGAQAANNLRQEARARGIDAGRLVFAPRVPYAEHLARLAVADLFLDTLPFNAGTMASDALGAGVPVLTCAGEAFAARMAGSLLRTVGLPELVTFDLATYERRALELARDPTALGELRARLGARAQVSLFDTPRFVRDLERAFEHMVHEAALGRRPRSFQLDTITPGR